MCHCPSLLIASFTSIPSKISRYLEGNSFGNPPQNLRLNLCNKEVIINHSSSLIRPKSQPFASFIGFINNLRGYTGFMGGDLISMLLILGLQILTYFFTFFNEQLRYIWFDIVGYDSFIHSYQRINAYLCKMDSNHVSQFTPSRLLVLVDFDTRNIPPWLFRASEHELRYALLALSL